MEEAEAIELPDEILLAIFDLLPIHERYVVGLVCLRWYVLFFI